MYIGHLNLITLNLNIYILTIIYYTTFKYEILSFY